MAPLGSRLKFVLVMNGCVRYVASSTTVVTVNHSSLSPTVKGMTYSVTTAFSLYGTPFFRSHPPCRLVVVTLSGRQRGFGEAGGAGVHGPMPSKPQGPSPTTVDHSAFECP